MKAQYRQLRWGLVLFMIMAYGLLSAGCSGQSAPAQVAPGNGAEVDKHEGEDDNDHEDEDAHDAAGEMLVLPALQPARLNGGKLKVVATTSIIGDIVTQVGGDNIELTTLMAAGQDPHSYDPTARDLTAVATADIVFLNGWELEEGLVRNLESVATDGLLLPVSANITPLVFGETHTEEGEEEQAAEEEEAHGHEGADPHVWFDIHHVEQWVENIFHVLSQLDPAQTGAYRDHADAYLDELAELKEYTASQLAAIPAEKRFLVTNHDSLAYFAHAYGFEIVGTVIPGASTLAEPSARELTGLITTMKAHGICAIFTETIANDRVAQTVAAELDTCERVQVLPLHTDAIGPVGSGANSYIDMYRANVDTIVAGLK